MTAACGGSGPAHHLPYNIEPPVEVPDMRMRSGEGFRLSSAMDQRRVALVFFGYTRCPDVCPDTLKRLGTALGRLSEGRRSQVLVLFVSVDERESESDAVVYAKSFHPGILSVAPRQEDLIRITADYGILASPQGKALDHSSSVLWIEPGLKLRKRIASGFSPDALAHDLMIVTTAF